MEKMMKDSIEEEFNNLKTQFEKQVEEVNKECSNRCEKIQKLLDEKQITESMYNEYINKSEIARENKIREIKEEFSSKRKEFMNNICDKLLSTLDRNFDNKKEELNSVKKELEKNLYEIEEEINQISARYDDDVASIEEEIESKKKDLKLKSKEFETKKLKKEYIIIPDEKKEEILKYVNMGAIPFDIINELEIAKPNETLEKIYLEKFSNEENQKKISVGREYEKSINEKIEIRKELSNKITEVNENIEKIIKEYENNKKEIKKYITDDITR